MAKYGYVYFHIYHSVYETWYITLTQYGGDKDRARGFLALIEYQSFSECFDNFRNVWNFRNFSKLSERFLILPNKNENCVSLEICWKVHIFTKCQKQFRKFQTRFNFLKCSIFSKFYKIIEILIYQNVWNFHNFLKCLQI